MQLSALSKSQGQLKYWPSRRSPEAFLVDLLAGQLPGHVLVADLIVPAPPRQEYFQ